METIFPLLNKPSGGQENANPETNNFSQSTLRSQPLAIVRASLDLQLKGLPQANKSWRALNHDMDADGIARACREFTAVKFPVNWVNTEI